METSGNSSCRAASTAPIVIRRAARPGASGLDSRGGCARARIEHQPELADLDLVAGVQDRLVDALTVDVGAVERPHVAHDEAAALTTEGRVLAGDGDVVEEDVGVGVATGADLVGVEQEARAGVRATQDDQQGGALTQGVDRRLVGSGQATLLGRPLDVLEVADPGEPHRRRFAGADRTLLLAVSHGVSTSVFRGCRSAQGAPTLDHNLRMTEGFGQTAQTPLPSGQL